MNIRIEQGQDRRIAWTDRKKGFLELVTCTTDLYSGGYYRGEKRYLSDFFLAMSCPDSVVTDMYRTNAQWTEVRPDGCSVAFPCGPEEVLLNFSLLLDEQSFYLSLSGAFDLGIIIPPEQNMSNWSKKETDGITLWCNEDGYALASPSSFGLKKIGDKRIVIESAEQSKSAPFWYLVFEENTLLACEKALRLVREKAIETHRQKVAEFLSACTFDSGDDSFDKALRWGQFSGWMLVTEDHGKGIWAGLPWFRDNWGRDTFISLTGILLVSGRFEEAKEVLTGFAQHQNKDSQSPDFGRIPNRYRGDNDVLYNTADGTLWFIRALWEYIQYSADFSILDELGPVVDRALDADMQFRTDSRGFLLHGDADTWMDARINGNEPWSPRGDRANDIQALWYTALGIGSHIARLRGDLTLAKERLAFAGRVRESFNRYFWCPQRSALADYLPPGEQGEWLRDFKVRPNQLFALTVPTVVDFPPLLEPDVSKIVLENVRRELVSPFGLFSLSPEDPLFHPRHEYPFQYHKDAAYHNGTIWLWNTGPYVTGVVNSFSKKTDDLTVQNLPHCADVLLSEEARMLVSMGCVGSLSENIHAEPSGSGSSSSKSDTSFYGEPVLSGTWSQAWSLAEFARNMYQDVLGFNPRLAENKIDFRPTLPERTKQLSARVQFGPRWICNIDLSRTTDGKKLHCKMMWNIRKETEANQGTNAIVSLKIGSHLLEPGKLLEFDLIVVNSEKETFTQHRFDNDFCGSIQKKDYLEQLIFSGRMKTKSGGGSNAAALEWFFDSDFFIKKYQTRLPLGALCTETETVFRLWAPTARSVSLILYPDGAHSERHGVISMKKGSAIEGKEGIWEKILSGDYYGTYYTFQVSVHGIVRETADPYALSAGVNGKRSMVVDFSRTNSEGWSFLSAPKVMSPNDVVVYEMHIADVTSASSWNGREDLKRTYEGVVEKGTSCKGVKTGFDHFLSLGITHVQVLPFYDFSSVDESRMKDKQYREQFVSGAFNWGYDPQNYCAPEGSYSQNPEDGQLRILELKTLIASFLHEGIGVIMDVVYNHVPSAQDHSLGISVPGYYFRVESFSGAGDDTASERVMFRSYMIQSLRTWLSEYKLSGFRFDLMGLHDVETMNDISDALRSIKKDVLIYGEGWDMYRGGKMVSASMKEARKMPSIGFFNDAFRCGLKGPVFSGNEPGFIHNGSHRESVKFGLVGAVYHPDVHNRFVDGTANPNPWTDTSATSVNYTEIHDNATLYDKLVLVENDRSEVWYERLHKTVMSLVILAQGMPVIHAGMEFMRTKEIPADMLLNHPHLYDLYWTSDKKRAFSHNSYNLSDVINRLDWERCAEKEHIVDYIRGLISIRRSHPLFRLQTTEEVSSAVTFIEPTRIPSPPALVSSTISHKGDIAGGQNLDSNSTFPEPLLVWTINGAPSGDTWKKVCIAVNPEADSQDLMLPECSGSGSWHLVADGETVNENSSVIFSAESKVSVPGKALYLYAEF